MSVIQACASGTIDRDAQSRWCRAFHSKFRSSVAVGPECPAAVGISQNANDFQLLGDAGAGTVELQKEGWTFGETEMALAVARDHRARVEKLHARDGDPRLDGLNHGIDRTLYAGEIPACGNDLFGLPMKAQGRLHD